MNRSIIALAVFACLLLNGCSGEKPASAAQPKKPKEGSVAPRPSVVSVPTQPYREISVASPGKISGTVEFDGAFPAPTPPQVLGWPPIARGFTRVALAADEESPDVGLLAQVGRAQ